MNNRLLKLIYICKLFARFIKSYLLKPNLLWDSFEVLLTFKNNNNKKIL